MAKNSIIWIIGLLIALASGLTAMGAITKNKAPQIATTLSPMNGFAAESIALGIITATIARNGGQFTDQFDPKASELARQAFEAEPLTPGAVAVLALGKTGQLRRKVMTETSSLSRRQTLVTAWMIFDSGNRQDISVLLDHYDIMLRTNSSAASVIIPLMVDTLANEDFIAPMASVLGKQPPWANRFWAAVVSNKASIANAARLRETSSISNATNQAYLDGSLISALVNNGQFAAAEALFHRLNDRAEDDSLLENASFAMEPKYAPMDWQLFSTGEYGAVVTDGRIEMSAIRNSGGLFARQLVKLPAKTVTMGIRPSAAIPDDARITVSLKCAESMQNAPQIIRIPLRSEIADLNIDNSTSGCRFYWLELDGRASDSGDGFEIALDSISLK